MMIAVGQVLFKVTSERLLAAGDAPFVRAVLDPVFIGAVALYTVATVLWIWVLKQVPLGYAYSFMAMTFVFVPVLAALFLGESFNPRYAVGTALIVVGLVVTQV